MISLYMYQQPRLARARQPLDLVQLCRLHSPPRNNHLVEKRLHLQRIYKRINSRESLKITSPCSAFSGPSHLPLSLCRQRPVDGLCPHPLRRPLLHLCVLDLCVGYISG